MDSSAAALVADLVQALLDEEAARRGVRVALARQAALLRGLRGLGLPATRVAHRVAAARGVVLPLAARRRFAARLRQRLSRVTRGHTDLTAACGQTASTTSPFMQRAIPSADKEQTMPKLVKRTVTEEYVEEKDEERDEEQEDADDTEEESPHEAEPRPRSRRK